MNEKELAVSLIKKKLNNEGFMSYKDIAIMTGYHPKYILRLKKELLNQTISLTHGNKNREPSNKITEKEKQYIISLYKRSHVSVRKFVKFYGKRSYSCIYSILKKEDLL